MQNVNVKSVCFFYYHKEQRQAGHHMMVSGKNGKRHRLPNLSVGLMMVSVFFAWGEMLLEAIGGLYSLFLSVSSISGFPPRMSAEEEKKCIEAMAGGDRSARQRLIEHNLRLVAHISKKYYTTVSDGDDLISIGTIGLIKAVDTFKPNKGSKFSSYASTCIQNEILMYLRSGKKSALDISMNEPIDTDRHGNVLTLMDIIAVDDTIADDIDAAIKCTKMKRIIREELSDTERNIIVKRYGLDGRKPRTQREIASELKISRSYVSRIEKKILERMRSKM